MIEPERILQPLDGADPQIERLTSYRSPADLTDALRAVAAAVDQSLRRLLRADAAAPDDHRLGALDPAAFPHGRVVESLRSRERVSLELAGMVHELTQVARRAEAAEPRASDADLALRTVARLRTEVEDLNDRAIRAVAHHAIEERRVAEPVHAVEPVVGRRFGGRAFALVATVVAVLVVLALAWVLTRSLDNEMDEAVAAFRGGRLGVAEEGFEQVLRDAPDNVTALLYLGRIYRRQGRFEEAAEALRRAEAAEPDDADIHRELGLLFRSLERPDLAAKEFQRAVELEPDESRNWIWLVRALRDAGDPTADEWLRRAPDEARAALGGA